MTYLMDEPGAPWYAAGERAVMAAKESRNELTNEGTPEFVYSFPIC
jgi:hypothetical protein